MQRYGVSNYQPNNFDSKCFKSMFYNILLGLVVQFYIFKSIWGIIFTYFVCVKLIYS